MKTLLMLAIVSVSLGSIGCERPLFPEDLPRTQYERYDRLRGRYIPSDDQNAHGISQPNLRERLTPGSTNY